MALYFHKANFTKSVFMCEVVIASFIIFSPCFSVSFKLFQSSGNGATANPTQSQEEEEEEEEGKEGGEEEEREEGREKEGGEEQEGGGGEKKKDVSSASGVDLATLEEEKTVRNKPALTGTGATANGPSRYNTCTIMCCVCLYTYASMHVYVTVCTKCVYMFVCAVNLSSHVIFLFPQWIYFAAAKPSQDTHCSGIKGEEEESQGAPKDGEQVS